MLGLVKVQAVERAMEVIELTVHPYKLGVFGGGRQCNSESGPECGLEEEYSHDERSRNP